MPVLRLVTRTQARQKDHWQCSCWYSHLRNAQADFTGLSARPGVSLAHGARAALSGPCHRPGHRHQDTGPASALPVSLCHPGLSVTVVDFKQLDSEVLKVPGTSCPSWQWHKTGYRWSPARTIPVAPLWCDLGCCSRTVVVTKLRRISALPVFRSQCK